MALILTCIISSILFSLSLSHFWLLSNKPCLWWKMIFFLNDHGKRKKTILRSSFAEYSIRMEKQFATMCWFVFIDFFPLSLFLMSYHAHFMLLNHGSLLDNMMKQVIATWKFEREKKNTNERKKVKKKQNAPPPNHGGG